MSKRSLFWGQASGKLGEAVYYRSGGEQRTRTYVGKIKNPKTYAQMANRLPMANLVAVYRALRPFLKGAFENKAARRSDFNEFFALNKNRLSYVQTKGDAALGLYVPNGLKVSKGTIALTPRITFENDRFEEPHGVVSGLFSAYQTSDVAGSIEYGAPVTAADLYRVMTAGGNPNQLPSRFKVTLLLFVYGWDTPDGADGEAWQCAAIQYDCFAGSTVAPSIVGRVAADTTLPVWYGTEDIDNNGFFSELLGIQTTGVMTQGQQLACIVSYTMDGVQRVTSSEIVPSNDAIRLAADFRRGGAVWEAALNEYGYNPDTRLSTQVEPELPAIPDAPDGGGAPDEEGPADD